MHHTKDRKKDQFQLPMDSFDHIENMENTLRDHLTRQQMVYRLRGVNIIFLNHKSFFLDSYAAPNWGMTKKRCIL